MNSIFCDSKYKTNCIGSKTVKCIRRLMCIVIILFLDCARATQIQDNIGNT